MVLSVLQAVTALAFTPGGDVLVSGSEDTLVSAWLLADLLDQEASSELGAGAGSISRPQPFRSW